MDVFETKAREVLRKFIAKTNVLSEDGTYSENMVEIVKLALKEQDRDTRHGCAEAVLQCENVNELNGDTDVVYFESSDVHDACMNYNANNASKPINDKQ